MFRRLLSATMLLAVLSGGTPPRAAELRVLSSTALGEVLREQASAFQRAHGDTLVVELDTATGVKRRIDAGAPFDIAIVTPAQMAELVQAGWIGRGTTRVVARVGYGVAIRTGAARPDIATPDAFRAALLATRAVIYSKEGQSGIHMTAVMQRLGIVDAKVGRIILKTTPGPVAAEVADGTAELGIQSITELLAVPGVEVLGPLPGDLQAYTVLAAGIAPGSSGAAAARAFIGFLGGAESAVTMRRFGIEPVTP